MAGRFVDLHIHSYYSDGTMSPEEIVNDAKRRNMGLIAVCDHSMLEGSRELCVLCEKEGIGYIPGVEIDCLDEGRSYHVLGYGIDLYDADFVKFIERNRELLDDISVKLVEKMSTDLPVSLSEYDSFSYDKRLGGWKCLHYLVHKGLAQTLQDTLDFYAGYQCLNSIVDFPSISEAVSAVHKAGGYAVFAHPGKSVPYSGAEDFENKLKKFLEMGLDGVECYYPAHTDELTAKCLSACREKKLLMTAGSDCHGSFGKTSIGEMKITFDMLYLKDLISRDS